MPTEECADKLTATSQSSLNFLFVSSDTFPPFRVDVSVLFGEEFRQRGHQIDWVLQSEKPLKKASSISWGNWRVQLGTTNDGESLLQRIRKHAGGIINDLRIIQLARKNDYQFIQVKDKFLAAVIAAAVSKRFDCGFTYWLSYPYPEASTYEAKVGTARYPLLYRIRGAIFSVILYRIVARHANHIFVQSAQMKRDMIAKGVRPDLLSVVPMGFSPDQSEVSPEPVNRYQITYVGTLLQTRKLDFLIRVLAKVKEHIPSATLLMVGPEELPGDMALLEDAAKDLQLKDSVELTGRLPRREAFKHIAQSGVCVSPFYPTPILNSTSPTKLIEYFALGRPAVANDHPEQSLVLEESGGGHCVPYDEAKFAAAIVDLMQHPEEADEMGQKGKRYVFSERTYAVIADRVERTYLELFQRM